MQTVQPNRFKINYMLGYLRGWYLQLRYHYRNGNLSGHTAKMILACIAGVLIGNDMYVVGSILFVVAYFMKSEASQ